MAKADVREVSATGNDAATGGRLIEGTRMVNASSSARPIESPSPFFPENCQGQVKATGHACMAKPLKGGTLCYGHSRNA